MAKGKRLKEDFLLEVELLVNEIINCNIRMNKNLLHTTTNATIIRHYSTDLKAMRRGKKQQKHMLHSFNQL